MKSKFGFWEKIFNPKLTGKERRSTWQKEYISMALLINNGDRDKTAKWTGYSKRAIRVFINQKYPELNTEWPTGYKILNDFYKRLKGKDYYWTGDQKEVLRMEHKKAMEAFNDARKTNQKKQSVPETGI